MKERTDLSPALSFEEREYKKIHNRCSGLKRRVGLGLQTQPFCQGQETLTYPIHN